MAIGQPLYTGKDTGVKLPNSGELERSRARLSETVIGAEQESYKRKTKKEDDFLKALNIDPLTLIADNARIQQADLLQKYNDKYAKRYKERNGELKMEDRIEMQRDKDLLASEQNSMMADQETYMNDKALYARDTKNYYDKEKFAQAEKDYFESGKYDRNALQPRPLNPATYFNSIKKDINGRILPDGRVVDIGGGMQQSVQPNISEDEARALIPSLVMEDEQVLRGLINEFSDLPFDQKKGYLSDVNDDGKINSDDAKIIEKSPMTASNPIIAYAQEKYWKAIQWEKPGSVRNKPSSGSSSGGSLTFDFGGSSYKYDAPSPQDMPNLLGVDYNSYYQFLRTPTISPTFAEVYKDGGVKVTVGGSVPVKLMGYDGNTDRFFFEVQSDRDDLDMSQQEQFYVTRDKLPVEFSGIKVMQDGKQVSVSDLKRNAPTAPTKPTVELNATARSKK